MIKFELARCCAVCEFIAWVGLGYPICMHPHNYDEERGFHPKTGHLRVCKWFSNPEDVDFCAGVIGVPLRKKRRADIIESPASCHYRGTGYRGDDTQYGCMFYRLANVRSVPCPSETEFPDGCPLEEVEV
jgi:hypothetical protein